MRPQRAEEVIKMAKQTRVNAKQISDIQPDRDLDSRIRQIEHMQTPVDTVANLPVVNIDGAICLVKDTHIFHQYILATDTWVQISAPVDTYKSVTYTNTVTIPGETNQLTIGIPEFNRETDTLNLYHRGIRLEDMFWSFIDDNTVELTYIMKRSQDRMVFVVEGPRLIGGGEI